MNKQTLRSKIRHPHFIRRSLNLPASLRALIVISLTFVGCVGIVQQVNAAQTSSAYCAKYTSNSKLNACKDGIKGADCSDYAITFDEEHAQICRDATKADISDMPTISVTPTPSPSSTTQTPAINQTAYKNIIIAACNTYKSNTAAYNACLFGGSAQSGSTSATPKTNQECLTNAEYKNNAAKQKACIAGSTAGQKYVADQANKGSGASSNPFSFLDQLDQSKDLSQFVDTLHANGQDKGVDVSEVADDNLGSYVNGAGKQQPITVTPCASGGVCPAILFFNGGGWHANDLTSKWVAEGSSKRNGTEAEIGAPAGGGATQRGFTVFDVTYRLGSSSVYYAFEDVMRGIQHVISNADKYRIDPAKIAIFGDSAGGSLSMRAAGSGKSGAKVAVGWSPPTNAYTGLFRSYKSLLIGMDHSTCTPTDLAGLTNTTDLLNGGSGDVAEYGQGLSSNDFSSLGIGGTGGGGAGSNPLGLLTEVLTAGQYAMQTGQNAESISKQLESGGIQGMSGGVINLASKKFGECIDNFNALSPALFASPETPPSFVGGFKNDDVVGPEQVTGMYDKLQSLGIRSEQMILDGDPEAPNSVLGASGNHLGYNPLFVCRTLNFIISVMEPDKGAVNCGTGISDNQGSNDTVAGGTGGSGGASSGGSGASGGGNSNGSGGTPSGASTPAKPCANIDTSTKGGKDDKAACESKNKPAPVCDTWQSSCNGGTTLPGANVKNNTICPGGQVYVYASPGQTAGCRSGCPVGYANKGTYCARIANAN